MEKKKRDLNYIRTVGAILSGFREEGGRGGGGVTKVMGPETWGDGKGTGVDL